MKLRKGRTKSTLESSIDSALLAVEVYNKPRTAFRSGAFITFMVIAWTRLFHAYFNSKGTKYFYKKNGKFETVDGEPKCWELSTCIKKYKLLSQPVEKNLDFFIKLRNKIEHRYIESREIDERIFGECQAFLFNYESILIDLFGANYAINESLVYSLQFSRLRTGSQQKANKSVLSKDTSEVSRFIDNYRKELPDDIYGSQEFSIKLIQIPKISNTSRADLAVEFVRWDELNEKDREAYQQIAVIIKDKRVIVDAVNVKGLKPSDVWARVNKNLESKIVTQNLHVTLYKLFNIRPSHGAVDPFDTNTEFCLYDETHNDYIYRDAWVDFLTHFFQTSGLSPSSLRDMQKNGSILKVDDYRIN
jgi:hypothetical protein